MVYIIRATYSLLTLYMILILIRWLGPWLRIDFTRDRLRWVPKLTDPLISGVRRVLPPMGPIDFGPAVSVLFLWFVRSVSLWILMQSYR